MAIIVSCCSAVINRPFDYLFELLYSPTAPTTPDFHNSQQEGVLKKELYQNDHRSAREDNRKLTTRRSIDAKAISQLLAAHEWKKSRTTSIINLLVDTVQIDTSVLREIPEEVVELHDNVQSSVQTLSTSLQYIQQQHNRRSSAIPTIDDELYSDVYSLSVRQVSPVQRVSARVHPYSLEFQFSPYTLFQKDLLEQVEMLGDNVEERKEYLEQWGLGDGETIANIKRWAMLAETLNTVQISGDQSIQKLKQIVGSSSSNVQIGHELLHLFVLDLLGRNTPAAVIYHAKMDAEFKHTRIVSFNTKVLVILLIILLDAIFAYYVVLKGFVKGISWQYSYLFACILQLASEIIVFETMEAFWMDFLIPSFVVSDVQQAIHQVLTVVHTLCSIDSSFDTIESSRNKSDKKIRYFFNVAEHLFISYNVAKKFPKVLESMTIMSYFNHLPGE